MTLTTPLVLVDGVSRVFGEERTRVLALDQVSFEVDAGELVVVMGPSGSGKTTLLTIVGGLLRPTSGRVVVDGLELTAMKPRELPRVRRHLVGFVFQTFNLLESLTAVENVEIALNVAGITGAEARTRARALLADSGLEERLHFGARDLSAGEKQRVALARALANSPKVLLADEPTANLDARSGRDVMQLLADLTQRTGAGALVVSHDERLRAVADRVLVLEDGRLAGPGLLGAAVAAPMRSRIGEWVR